MCGRYVVFMEEEIIEMREIINELNRRYLNTPEHAAMKTGEIFPTNVAPVLTGHSGDLHPELMNWGFPKWQGSGVIINARAESALEKPMFRGSLTARRCVVPSTGFYEWRHSGAKKKEKYLVRQPQSPMLYMAGFYNTFTDALGKPYAGFVILTAPANETISALHDRMPIVLNTEQRRRWLSDSTAAMSLLAEENHTEFSLQQVTAESFALRDVPVVAARNVNRGGEQLDFFAGFGEKSEQPR